MIAMKYLDSLLFFMTVGLWIATAEQIGDTDVANSAGAIAVSGVMTLYIASRFYYYFLSESD